MIYMNFKIFMPSEFKSVTECRDDRDDAYCIPVCREIICAQPLLVDLGSDWVQPAVGIIYAEVPYARIASLCILNEVQPNIKPMIIRQFDIIWFRIYIPGLIPVCPLAGDFMTGYGNSVAAVPVPCTIYLEPLSELVLRHKGKFVTIIVPVPVPAVIEIIELPLRP